MLFDKHGAFFVPGYPLEEVLDPTGAGDTFAGGLLGYLARHDDTSNQAMRRAMFFGSAMGSFCVEGIGTSKVTSLQGGDLARRIEQFRALVDFGGALDFSVDA
jgi:sugar/nucleoside kinase (ribokinase family)